MEQATKNQINELVTEKRAARTTAKLWSEPVLSNLFFEIAAPISTGSMSKRILDDPVKRVSLAGWAYLGLS
jgi:hypothetical protein